MNRNKTTWAYCKIAGRDGICDSVDDGFNFWPVTKLCTIEMQLNFCSAIYFHVNKMGNILYLHSPNSAEYCTFSFSI